MFKIHYFLKCQMIYWSSLDTTRDLTLLKVCHPAYKSVNRTELGKLCVLGLFSPPLKARQCTNCFYLFILLRPLPFQLCRIIASKGDFNNVASPLLCLPLRFPNHVVNKDSVTSCSFIKQDYTDTNQLTAKHSKILAQ